VLETEIKMLGIQRRPAARVESRSAAASAPRAMAAAGA